MKRLWQCAAVMFLAADTVLLLLFGRRWVRFTHFGSPDGIYYRVANPDWFRLTQRKCRLPLSGSCRA